MKTILIARSSQKWLQYRMPEETFNLLDGFVVGGALRMGWSNRLEELIEMLPSVLKKTITKSEVDPPKNGRTITYVSFDEAAPDAPPMNDYKAKYEVPIELNVDNFQVEYRDCGTHQMNIKARTNLKDVQALYDAIKATKGLKL